MLESFGVKNVFIHRLVRRKNSELKFKLYTKEKVWNLSIFWRGIMLMQGFITFMGQSE